MCARVSPPPAWHNVIAEAQSQFVSLTGTFFEKDKKQLIIVAAQTRPKRESATEVICEVARKIILKSWIKRFAAFLTVSKLKGHIASEKKYNKLTRGSVSVVLSHHEKQKLFGDFFLFTNELGKKKKKNWKEKRSCFFLTLILCRDVFIIYFYWLSRSIYLGTHNIFLEMAILICVFGIEWWKIRFPLILFSITRLICRGVRTSMFTFLNHLARTCLEKKWLAFVCRGHYVNASTR